MLHHHDLFIYLFIIIIIIFFFLLLGPHLWHLEVPRVGVTLELQLPPYATATAMQDLSHIYNPHHSSWQRQIFNPLSKARDRTCNLMVSSRICFYYATMGTLTYVFYIWKFVPFDPF